MPFHSDTVLRNLPLSLSNETTRGPLGKFKCLLLLQMRAAIHRGRFKTSTPQDSQGKIPRKTQNELSKKTRREAGPPERGPSRWLHVAPEVATTASCRTIRKRWKKSPDEWAHANWRVKIAGLCPAPAILISNLSSDIERHAKSEGAVND